MRRKVFVKSELTPKQTLAVELYVNPKSESFGNRTQSYIAAGYSCRGRTAQQAACRLYANSKMCKAIKEYQDKNIEISSKQAVNEAITKTYTLDQLQKTYDAAKKNGDTTNRVACIRLMMQYHGLLSDKLVIDLQDSRQLEEGHREAARRIAAQFLSDGILDATFEPIPLLDTTKDEDNQSDKDSTDNIVEPSE